MVEALLWAVGVFVDHPITLETPSTLTPFYEALCFGKKLLLLVN